MVAGTYDENLIPNMMICGIDFPNRDIKEYAANIIAKNMLTQVNLDRYSLKMMKGIINYKRHNAVAVPKNAKYVVTIEVKRS
jgi:hypothetical protein